MDRLRSFSRPETVQAMTASRAVISTFSTRSRAVAGFYFGQLYLGFRYAG